jgi:site-specific DNA recombinase
VSGTRADRPALQRLLADVRSGRIQAVVVHKLDRLARSVRIANDLIEEFQRRNIAFVAVADRIDLSTPFGWAAFQVQNVWNELYIKNLSFETSKGHTEKARRGLWVGPVPYGYARDGKTLIPSADAPVVARIFEWYATGRHSFTSIADQLNALGYRTLDWKTGERRLFGRESIRTLLKNRAYCGYVSSGGVEYQDVHPPLVSEELWQQVNSIRSERTIAGGVVKLAPVDAWVLQGLVYCAACGAKMWIHPSGPKQHRQRNYLCSGRSRRTCQAPYVHAEPIEE